MTNVKCLGLSYLGLSCLLLLTYRLMTRQTVI